MRQLDLLIAQVWLRTREELSSGSVLWNKLPQRVRAEVIEQLAEMLRARLEQREAVEAGDE
jgi:hypothetical protein